MNQSGSSLNPQTLGWSPSIGVNPIMSQTLPSSNASSNNSPASVQSPSMSSAFFGEPIAVWLGAIILLFVLKWLSERKESGYNPAYIKIGGYNVMAIGLSSMIFIIVMKVLFNSIYVPGVTQFANAA
jgi:hypothetical protein